MKIGLLRLPDQIGHDNPGILVAEGALAELAHVVEDDLPLVGAAVIAVVDAGDPSWSSVYSRPT